MGACQSGNGDQLLSRSINQDINADKKRQKTVKKVLFLGSAGSGKSTMFKQLRLIHGKGFNDIDREKYIVPIHIQIIEQMKDIIQIYINYNHRKQQRLNQSDSDLSEDELLVYDDIELLSQGLDDMSSAEFILRYEYDKHEQCLSVDVQKAIQSLWSESVIKEIYNLRNVTHIESSSAHFWDKIDAIKESNYLPNDEDILLNRNITTGLYEQNFEINNFVIHIIDVGGQRSQRRKWIHCFEHVVAVIFIASLSCYDEIMIEDQSTNAMTDQLVLFGEICNNRVLSDVSMILFLNKTDLFREKYCSKNIPLTTCDKFSSFTDESCDFTKSTKYISQKFEGMNKIKSKLVFTHLTCATDTNNVEKVFGDVQSIILSGNMSEGLF